jgi:DNA processing protein
LDPRDLASRLTAAMGSAPDPESLEATARWIREPGRYLLAPGDALFPALLLEIPDPPKLLFAMGRVELLQGPCLAIVGSRAATPQGARDARSFAFELSNAGLCIVSGLALGIDTAAHEGALEGSSSSVAVLGTGANIVYPRGNEKLASRLAESGCVLTEYGLDTPPRPGNFPRRNRLISGLALGVLVVEASVRSGSLRTARLGAEHNREVFALPGSIHNTNSRGCHRLIREGAKLVECTNDVLEELGMERRAEARAPRSARHRDPVLAAMGRDPISLDQIMLRTGLSAAACAARLSMLEIDGRVEGLSGGLFQQVDGAS